MATSYYKHRDPANKKYSPALRYKIERAVEMTFGGCTQEDIAKELGVSRVRISQFKLEPLWKEAWEKLENLRASTIAEVKNTIQLENTQKYESEILDWLENSKHMVNAEMALYGNLMKLATEAVRAALKNPNSIAASNSLKNVPNLVRAAVLLHQNIDASLSQQLAISEVKTLIETTSQDTPEQ